MLVRIDVNYIWKPMPEAGILHVNTILQKKTATLTIHTYVHNSPIVSLTFYGFVVQPISTRTKCNFEFN